MPKDSSSSAIIPPELLELLRTAGLDPIQLLQKAILKNDTALNARIPAALHSRIKNSADDNLSARIRELLEMGFAAERAESEKRRTQK